MSREELSKDSKIISVRLRCDDLEQIDSKAAAVELKRSEFIRARCLFDSPVEYINKIDELVEAIALHNGKIDRLRLAVLNLSADAENLETSEYLHEYWGVMVRLSYLQDQLFELLKQLTNDVSKIRRRICRV